MYLRDIIAIFRQEGIETPARHIHLIPADDPITQREAVDRFFQDPKGADRIAFQGEQLLPSDLFEINVSRCAYDFRLYRNRAEIEWRRYTQREVLEAMEAAFSKVDLVRIKWPEIGRHVDAKCESFTIEDESFPAGRDGGPSPSEPAVALAVFRWPEQIDDPFGIMSRPPA